MNLMTETGIEGINLQAKERHELPIVPNVSEKGMKQIAPDSTLEGINLAAALNSEL